MSVIGVIGSCLRLIKPLNRYVRSRLILKRAKPNHFTIISKTENEELIYTSGEVISLGFRTVKVRGYQVMDWFNENGDFEISLLSIIRVTERDKAP